MKTPFKFYFLAKLILSASFAVISIPFFIHAGETAGNILNSPVLIGSKTIVYEQKQTKYYQANAADLLEITENKETEIVMLFVGDIMLGRGVANSAAKNGNGEFFFIFQKTDFLKNADITFGNLEGPISDSGTDRKNLYSFRFEEKSSPALKEAGFDILSVANNHAGDWGRNAFEDTLVNLEKEGIIPVGGGVNKEESAKTKIMQINGLKIGFLGFSDIESDWIKTSDNESGILMADDSLAEVVKKSAGETDILVVSFHFGEEYQKKHNLRQEKLARLAVDNGAKIIIGHHPHVVQDTEFYKNGFIAYSLGNFVFDQNFSEETMQGGILEVKISPSGEIKSAEMKKIKINGHFQPELAQ